MPAVLLMGIGQERLRPAASASLAVPLMALAIPVPQAAAIMLPLLHGGRCRAAALMRERDRALLRLLLPAGLVGTVVGTLLFGVLSAEDGGGGGRRAHAAVPGAACCGRRATARPPPPRPARLTCSPDSRRASPASSRTPAGRRSRSRCCRCAWPRRCSPRRRRCSSRRSTRRSGCPYAWLGLIDATNMLSALVLAPFAPLGVWLGVKLLRRLPPVWFYRLVSAGMLVTGTQAHLGRPELSDAAQRKAFSSGGAIVHARARALRQLALLRQKLFELLPAVLADRDQLRLVAGMRRHLDELLRRCGGESAAPACAPGAAPCRAARARCARSSAPRRASRVRSGARRVGAAASSGARCARAPRW